MTSEKENTRKVAERKLEKIRRDETINQVSKDVFLRYVEFKKTEMISDHRLSRILDLFYQILKNFNYELNKLTQGAG